MRVNIIAACDQNGLIGINGRMPWYIPEDLQRFKRLTTGNAIIMGRKTWESLPIKPLPDRENIVIASIGKMNVIAEVYKSPKRAIFNNLPDALVYAEKRKEHEEVFIIGGQRLYEEALPLVDTVYLTKVKTTYNPKDNDEVAYFPLADMNFVDWELESCESAIDYVFGEWRRVK